MNLNGYVVFCPGMGGAAGSTVTRMSRPVVDAPRRVFPGNQGSSEPFLGCECEGLPYAGDFGPAYAHAQPFLEGQEPRLVGKEH
jgi:hypothetical protein